MASGSRSFFLLFFFILFAFYAPIKSRLVICSILLSAAGLKNTFQPVRPPVAVVLRVLFCKYLLPQVETARSFNPRETTKEVGKGGASIIQVEVRARFGEKGLERWNVSRPGYGVGCGGKMLFYCELINL